MRSGQIVQFPLSRGLAEDANAKAKPTASLKSGNNIRWVKEGTIGKRYASKVLGTVGVVPKRFIIRDGELAVTDGNRIYTWDPTTGVWFTGTYVSEVSMDWKTTLDSVTGVLVCDSATVSTGQIIETWVTGDIASSTSGALYYQVRDIATGYFVTSPTVIEASGVIPRIRIVSYAGTYVILYGTTGGDVKAFTGTSTTLKSDAGTSSSAFALDACIIDSDFVVAYSLAAGGIRLVRCTVAATPVEVTTDTVTGEASTTITAIGITGADGERLYLSYADGGLGAAVHRYIADDATLAQVVAVANVEAVNGLSEKHVAIVRVDATTALLVYSFQVSTYDRGITRVYTVADDGTSTLLRSHYFLKILSKPVLCGTHYYLYACPYILTASGAMADQTRSSDTLLVEVPTLAASDEPLRVVGKLDVEIGGAWFSGFVANPHVNENDAFDVSRYCSLPFQASPGAPADAWRQGARYVRIASPADHPDAYRNVQLDRECYIGGIGMLTAYDGADALGYGYPHPPYIDADNTVASAAGGTMATGAYLYNVTAERRSTVGIMHRAPMGVSYSVDVTGPTGSVTVAVATAAAGRSARNPGHYPIYRSEVDGSVLYRATAEPSQLFLADIATGTTAPVTVVDADGDNDFGPAGGLSLANRSQPYTASGELEDVMPPAPYTIGVHQGRIGIITGGRREFWFTKALVDNPGIAPGFNSALREIYDADLTAWGSLDDKRIMFAKDRIWYVVGDGPNVQGLDNRFSAPQPVQCDVGCTNPRSVVSWPGGLAFEHEGEIHNLGRGLEVTWLGRDVQTTLASYPSITSAVVIPEQNEIRWTCNNAAGTAGIILVYDYERLAWMTRTYPSDMPIADAVYFGGVYYFAHATSAAVRYEDTSTHLDGGTTFVSSTVELEPLTPAGPVGWQRVRLAKPIGQSLSNFSLTVSVARDWATSYEQTQSFAAGSDVTTPGAYMRAEVALTVPRRQAVQLKFVDATPSNTTAYPLTTGNGFQLEGVALLVQPRPGMPRDTASRRGG